MSIGSLFSGIGGLELGLERAGLGETLWQAESSAYCRGVLRHHWPQARLFSDVREVHRVSAAKVEVVCGGFPCQPVSVAGHGLGADDPRWLWPECLRIANDFNPEWCVWENVPMLRQRGLCGVLADLAESGWDAEWVDLRASDVGAPHRRERLFIVCNRSGARLDRWRAAVERSMAERHGLCGRGPVANGDGSGLQQQRETRLHAHGPLGHDIAGRSEAAREPRGHFPPLPGDREGWQAWDGPRPLVRRDADGLSDRVDRLRALGNAVVPLLAEVIGRAIYEAS